MSENVEEQYSEKYSETEEVVDCPLCHKAKISVTYIHPYVSWKVSHISAGSKRTKFYHDEKYKVHSRCQVCGTSREDIKDALERGSTRLISHEERLKRLQESGLPTKIVNKRD